MKVTNLKNENSKIQTEWQLSEGKWGGWIGQRG